jgi:Uma2 family endonuclease
MSLAPTIPPRPPDRPHRYFRLTVDQYHNLMESGVISEGAPYELIDGMILYKDRSAGENPTTIGRGHAWAVTALEELNVKLRRLGCYMRIQQPVTLPPYDEPEPDGALVTGTKDDYLERHPAAGDLLCVVEVADSSLEYDRTTKQQVYASSGVPMYVLVNLPEGLVEVYAEPVRRKGRYDKRTTFTGRQPLTLPTPGGKGLRVPAKTLLPPHPGS